EGKSAQDRAYLALAQKLRTKAQEVNSYLGGLKKEFIDITGGYLDPQQEGNLAFMAGKTDYDRVGDYMFPVEEGGKGNGAKLEQVLDEYVTFVKQIVKDADGSAEDMQFFKEIAQDAEESEIYRHDPNQEGKKFIQLAFESSPTPAALATVSEFQSKVLQYETAALEVISNKLGGTNIEFDKIVPMVLPKSQYVAAGAKYEAEMFISASTSSAVEPVMTLNDKNLEVSGGFGKVAFTATAGSSGYDPNGIAKKSFKASITVKNRSGQDTTFTKDIDYYVVKPVIQIQSDAVQALYLNCGNALDVQVPALGTAYNPSFSAKGGQAIKGSKIGKVTLVPTSGKMTLTVSNGGDVVGSRTFQVRRIPAPNIAVYDRNKPVNMKRGINAKTPRIEIKALPDESFQKFLPDDARFRVTEGEVTLVRAGNGIKSIRFTNPKINLAALTAQARKGDNIVIEVKKVIRANFRKQFEDFNNIPQSSRFITIPLN
ncbi:MAG: GldM family protein, partial [Bacteroidota bacterium]